MTAAVSRDKHTTHSNCPSARGGKNEELIKSKANSGGDRKSWRVGNGHGVEMEAMLTCWLSISADVIKISLPL